MPLEFTDNSGKVKSQMEANMKRALTAMGLVGMETVTDTMNKGYGQPIYLTGDLQRSMTFNVNIAEQSVTWGSNLNYAVYVHEGTLRMTGRPFLKDGILNRKDMLIETAEMYLKQGME
jgi:hypothetical protein